MSHTVDGLEPTLDAPRPVDEHLRGASPEGADLVARLARAGVESRLFGVPTAPVQVGRYRIERELGTGGMGVVYRAHDPELERDVALKLLNPKSTHVRDPEVARGRLIREARAMARLSHPNVLSVHEVGTFEEQVYVAMELVEGHTLADWLRGEPRSHEQILDVFLEAGRGLAAAHEEGIVHRDFKPENVMISDKGRVLVLDFGLARPSEGLQVSSTEPSHDAEVAASAVPNEEPDASLTRTGSLVGTPAYMAPEQYAGLPASERSDQFSYCVALWEALYGTRPFTGSTVAALAYSVTSGRLEPVPPDTSCPAWIRSVLERGLAVDAHDRHASMRALLLALETGRRRAVGRRRTVVLASTAVLLLLVGAATAVAFATRAPPPAPEPTAPVREYVVVQQSPPEASDTPMVTPPSVPTDPTEAVVEELEPQIEQAPRSRTRPTASSYTHAICFYDEDSYKDLAPQQGRAKFRSLIRARGECWACRLATDTERARSKAERTDCRRYAACGPVSCDDD
jgi:tRNA A-37 threonylcarbamoyl transferase component Bud32